MSEKEKKTNDEGKTIPRPEGYTFVKYSYLFVCLFSGFGAFASIFILIKLNVHVSDWLFWVSYFGTMLLFCVIGHKLTEVKVMLKITVEGLEQIRLSGSRFCPKYRMMEWGRMIKFHLYGGGRLYEFKIDMREGRNFRISIPLILIFEKQKKNLDGYSAFQNDFWEIAPKHGVHRGFFY